VNQHAGPSPSPAAPSPPEPTYAERARTLVHLAQAGTLATVSRRHPGHPFASVMPYAEDERGRPVLLISRLAVHTQNLEHDPRASLLVAQPGADDPLAAGRVTLLGTGERLVGAEAVAVRARYLERHPRARHWVDFEDFAFWRLTLGEIYFVGGFAAMDWVTAAEFEAARPDPLADVAADILEHMNRDHPDALLAYARGLAGAAADEVAMVAVDRLGFRLRIRSGDRLHATRLAFPREVRTAADARATLIEMLAEARRRTPA
jgi:hypothetical protein